MGLRLILRSLPLSLSSLLYSGLKINESWGKSFVTPAVGLRLILTHFGTQTNFDNVINTAGVRSTVCGVKFVTPAGLFRGN